jgi:HPt (histidine-containing phosphotransfer) domain-containing protein
MSTQVYINLSYIRALSGGNNGFVVRMLQSFCRNVPQGLSQLRHYLESDQLYELSEGAHKLKTMFRYVGMEDTADDLERLERDVTTMEAPRRKVLLDRIRKAADKAITEAESIITTSV